MVEYDGSIIRQEYPVPTPSSATLETRSVTGHRICGVRPSKRRYPVLVLVYFRLTQLTTYGSIVASARELTPSKINILLNKTSTNG